MKNELASTEWKHFQTQWSHVIFNWTAWLLVIVLLPLLCGYCCCCYFLLRNSLNLKRSSLRQKKNMHEIAHETKAICTETLLITFVLREWSRFTRISSLTFRVHSNSCEITFYNGRATDKPSLIHSPKLWEENKEKKTRAHFPFRSCVMSCHCGLTDWYTRDAIHLIYL